MVIGQQKLFSSLCVKGGKNHSLKIKVVPVSCEELKEPDEVCLGYTLMISLLANKKLLQGSQELFFYFVVLSFALFVIRMLSR